MKSGKVGKKLITAILLLALSFTTVLSGGVAASAQEAEPDSQQENESQIVGLGDSITAGYGLENETESYIHLVAEEKGKTLINHAVNGQTSDGLKKQLKKAAKGNPPGPDIKKAEYILLTIGGNDLMNALYKGAAKSADCSQKQLKKWLANPEEDAASFYKALGAIQKAAEKLAKGNINKTVSTAKKNLKDSIASIRKLNSKAVIIVQTQYNPYFSLSDNTVFAPTVKNVDSCVKKYNKAVKAVVKGKGCKVVDVYKAFKASDENLTNVSSDMASFNLDFHPNKEGHAVIAELISPLIKE